MLGMVGLILDDTRCLQFNQLVTSPRLAAAKPASHCKECQRCRAVTMIHSRTHEQDVLDTAEETVVPHCFGCLAPQCAMRCA